jgi:hypothetical protein
MQGDTDYNAPNPNRLSRLGHEPNKGSSADLFEPPRLSPVIVTDVLALTARFARSQLLTLTTGAERSRDLLFFLKAVILPTLCREDPLWLKGRRKARK